MSSESNKDHMGSRHSDHSPIHGSGWNTASASIEPLYNLFVAVSELVLTVDLPYVNEKKVKLRCPTKEAIEIFAATTRKITFHELGAKHRHGEFTSYHARIKIPVRVDQKKIKSKFKNGVLEIHVPRTK
ncbi:MAG TPA: Hsp20/alpha crystallin family protein [Candidatus Saccharimonadales bacterium]|jgi:HSP20 family molecular chaperone IbpA|nr:Hsp20/alpha crystallin family protein [Candidatus Saccharimonadales bacterium]